MGIPIARIFGIEIRVQLGWVIILALVAVVAVGQLTQVDPEIEELVAWVMGGIVALGFFASSVSHDLAHAIVARRRGVEVRSIAISFFGGATPFDPSSPDPGDDAAIAASGPIASLAIGAVLFGLWLGLSGLTGSLFTAVAGVLAVLVFLNLVLGVINLVPAYPLDGGRIVRDIAWRRSGSERSGWRAAARSGRLTGLLVVGGGISFLLAEGGLTGAMIALTGWFFVLSANSVRDRIRLDDLVGDQLVRDAMEDSATVTPSLTVDTFAAQLLDGESPMTAVPVVDGTDIVGLLGVAQVRRIRRGDWPKTRVEDVMAKPPKVTFIAPTDPLKQGLERIFRSGLDGLPVVEDGHLVGVLTKRGVGRFIGQKTEAAKSQTPPAP